MLWDVCDKVHENSPLTFPADLPLVEEVVGMHGAKLMVIDPFSAFLAASANSERNVRRALGPLATFAERAGVGILLIGHMNKSNSPNPLHRASGSIGIIAAVRSGLLVGRDPTSDDPHRRVLLQKKTNLASSSTGLAYRTAKRGNCIVVDCLGETTCTSQDLTGSGHADHSALQEAIEVLRSILAEGPVWSVEAIKVAAQAGIAKRTLDRARQALGVIPLKRGSGRGSKWIWVLHGGEGHLSSGQNHDQQDAIRLAVRRGPGSNQIAELEPLLRRVE